MSRSSLAAIAALALPMLAPGVAPAADFPLKDGMRVVFLGDSITHYGAYIQDIEAYLVTRFPDRKVELIDLGLSSETASGLTEPDHPYPRPDVRTRLARALELTRPNLVIVCYGMNDGIYHPPSPQRLQAYQIGITEVVDRIKKAGADVILATPPPFDPVPIASRTVPIGAKEFGYKHPYEKYDEVLEQYANWLLSKRADGWKVVDVHGEVERYVDARRQVDPKFTVAKDGVHPDQVGHWLIAQAFLKAWDAPAEVDSATVDAKALKATAGFVDSIKADGGGISFVWRSKSPMPHDPAWPAKFAAEEGIDARFNRQVLTVTGLDRPSYDLFEGDRKIATVPASALASGYSPVAAPEWTGVLRAKAIRTLVVERQRRLGAAWLQEVGHGPPDLGKGPALDEVRKVVAGLDPGIGHTAMRAGTTIRLVPSPEK